MASLDAVLGDQGSRCISVGNVGRMVSVSNSMLTDERSKSRVRENKLYWILTRTVLELKYNTQCP